MHAFHANLSTRRHPRLVPQSRDGGSRLETMAERGVKREACVLLYCNCEAKSAQTVASHHHTPTGHTDITPQNSMRQAYPWPAQISPAPMYTAQ